MNYERCIVDLVESDVLRMRALYAVRALLLPDWLIVAGFIRNLIWESLFNKKGPVHDIDVVYFCRLDTSRERDTDLEKQLKKLEPSFPWSVKSQARMHIKHGDAPYLDTVDVMKFWPEKQTGIGAMLNAGGAVIIRHCFDLRLQFSGTVDHNPARPIETFNNRVSSKGWLETWPALKVAMA